MGLFVPKYCFLESGLICKQKCVCVLCVLCVCITQVLFGPSVTDPHIQYATCLFISHILRLSLACLLPHTLSCYLLYSCIQSVFFQTSTFSWRLNTQTHWHICHCKVTSGWLYNTDTRKQIFSGRHDPAVTLRGPHSHKGFWVPRKPFRAGGCVTVLSWEPNCPRVIPNLSLPHSLCSSDWSWRKEKKIWALPNLSWHKEMFSSVERSRGEPRAWLTFQQCVWGTAHSMALRSAEAWLPESSWEGWQSLGLWHSTPC